MTNAEAINARKQAAKDLLECTKPHTKAAKKHDKKMDEAMKLALITFMNAI